MGYWTVALLVTTGICADWFFLRKPPFELSGMRLKKCVSIAGAVNVWTAVCMVLGGVSGVIWFGYFFLANGLFLISITDCREKMVYDLHFYVVLLAGAASAFLQPNAGFIGMYVIFLILSGVFFVVSRKNEGMGAGDAKIIAALSLYFPFSHWMEIMVMALGLAMLYGVGGVIVKKSTWKTEIPFVPFLLVAVLLELLML